MFAIYCAAEVSLARNLFRFRPKKTTHEKHNDYRNGPAPVGHRRLAQNTSDTAVTTANGKIGKMSFTEFQQKNKKGNETVAAIKPGANALSEADEALLIQVAAGGQMQLALSQAAVDKLQSPEAKILAQSEIEEQTGVAAKVKEIAGAKGLTLSDAPDTATQAALARMQGAAGGGLDAYYVRESGVNGHIKLETTMTTVLTNAQDAGLK